MLFHTMTLSDVFDKRTTQHVGFACKLMILVGAVLHVIAYTGPPLALAVSVFFIGGGLTAYASLILYRNQPQMQSVHFIPYVVGVVSAVAVVALGIGYGYIDRRVGLPFLAVVAVTLVVFARYFQYTPANHATGR